MKAESKLPRVSLLHVATPARQAGRLTRNGQHAFTYDGAAVDSADRAREISLTMPLRTTSYTWTPMLPVFQTFLPEGFLKQRIVERFGKIMRVDDMALLALTSENSIGRLRLSRSAQPSRKQTAAESLEEILQDQGSRDLFEYLSDKYLIGSGVAGVQPKVLLAANGVMPAPRDKISIGERATLRVRQLIVKIGGDEYPGLAENEFHCMRVAERLGLDLPKFHLSADRKRFVIERFDYDPDRATYLGFEDMVSLQGKVNEHKYEGSYELVAKAISNNATSSLRAKSLANYFASLVLSMALQNGDAHLKNFGMLYTDPGSDDCRLSPLYDIVCTTMYIPKDRPALAMAGKREWPDRETLCRFGRTHCQVEQPEPVIDATLDAVASYQPDNDDSGIWAQIAAQAARSCFALSKPGRTPRR